MLDNVVHRCIFDSHDVNGLQAVSYKEKTQVCPENAFVRCKYRNFASKNQSMTSTGSADLLVFHHWHTRSVRIVWLCEDLGVQYDLDVIAVRRF